MEKMGAEEFLRRLTNAVESPDCRFAFFIGAGCSITSGIPSAANLTRIWLRRLKKIRTGNEEGLLEWIKSEFEGYEDRNAADYYVQVIEKLFRTSLERQKEIEQWTEGKDPGFGYAVLAQLISHQRFGPNFNLVLTTNFDDMVSDALYLYTNKKPLIISHESLIGFVKSIRNRPLVIKLHGDARLEPKNTEVETKTLHEGVTKALQNLLSESGLIFIGYGGNDNSIVELLRNLPIEAHPWGVWWINQNLPKSELKEWLEERNAVWVTHKDFDELMLLFLHEFNFIHPKKDRFDQLIENYYETFNTLRKQVGEKPDSVEKRKMEEVLKQAFVKIQDWWEIELEARKYIDSNPELAEQIYQKGIKKFPFNIPLLNHYAIFLTDIRKDHAKAEKYLKKALELEENNEMTLGNYGVFLYKIHKDFQNAEEFYKRALEANPNYITGLMNYAQLLVEVRKDYDTAEEYYKKALGLEPNNAVLLGKYARFLDNIRKDYDTAEQYYEKALELEPNIVEILYNYADFLAKNRIDFKAAERHYKEALRLEPNNIFTLDKYAWFLKSYHRDYDTAEKFYKKILEIEPNNVVFMGKYAVFLTEIQEDYDTAEEYYKKILEIEPDNAVFLGKYAVFLTEIREDFNTAEEYYNKAFDLEPNNAVLLGNYARFLKVIRKNYDVAEEYFRKALELDPNHSAILGHFAIFLKDIRRDFEEADHYYKKSVEIEPNNSNLLGNYAGFLLAQGDREKGLELLDKAFQLELIPPALLPEILFYRFAHTLDENLRKETLIKLKEILKSGLRSPGWNLQDNVDRALNDGHPHPEFLKMLAKVIQDEIHIEELEKFYLWISS